ncbi:hypothetical protein EYF80_065661 [Liparis tanakae]|uniref:Uncharacterized protein n=1 Tax=Liparis tanakae TaxID=230148 RepID=A0A4Z2E5L9_9TELE|nr:hypothetical protein EYF80_065661 [Liparis tanakae]
MQSTAACLASWFSVDGPLCPDCSAPLSVSQLTKLSTADSPLTTRGTRPGFTLSQRNLPIGLHEILHLRTTSTEFEKWPLDGSAARRMSSCLRAQVSAGYHKALTREGGERSPDLHHGFGQELGSEQLEHGVHDVLPALPQDVAVPMGEVKHRLGCGLRFIIAAKHCRKVFHRLHRERTQQHSVNIYIYKKIYQ